MTESPDLLAIMHTLQAEGWCFDLYQVVAGAWRGWWYKPGDARYTRAGDPTGFNAALLKAWRLREYHEGGGMMITWRKVFPEADYSPMCGEDENGVRYTLSANQEVVTAVLPDGRAGAGWTEAEALSSALAQTPPGEHPANMRERLRALLDGLQETARRVYDRENLQAPGLPVVQVVETVLYSFDGDNQRKVAAALGLEYEVMCALLVGYVLGYESGD